MKFVFTLSIFLFAVNLFGQDTTSPKPCDTCKTEERILTICEDMPYFPGGESAFHDYLKMNLHWPDSAKDGTAYIRFVVEGDGSITNVTCVKGDPFFGAECVRVVAAMPKWVPGFSSGKPVRIVIVVPIRVHPE